MRPQDLCQFLWTYCASTKPSLNFLRCCWTFCQLPSSCCASAGHSVNFLCICGTHCQLSMCPRVLLSTFLASAGPFVNFCQLSLHLRDLPPTFCMAEESSVNFLSVSKTCLKFSMHLPDLPSTSVNFWVSSAPSVNFHQLSVRHWDLP